MLQRIRDALDVLLGRKAATTPITMVINLEYTVSCAVEHNDAPGQIARSVLAELERTRGRVPSAR